MRRLVVVGGTGFFGAVAVERLRADGARPVVASRGRGAELRVDVENRASIKSALRPYDVVLDAAGPFQRRTTALVEAAIETGIDLVDLSDSLRYAERVGELRLRIEAAGIRVLTSCSSISAMSAAAIRLSGIERPARLSVLLLPATRHSARGGAATSLLESVGRVVRVFQGGRLIERRGWAESRRLRWPATGRATRAYLCESVDGLFLPRIWPTLRRIDFYVDSHVPGLNVTLALAARSRPLRGVVAALMPAGLAVCRLLGSRSGGILFEVEGSDGALVSIVLHAAAGSYNVAVGPAVLAARALAEGRFAPAGLVPPDRHVDPAEIAAYLRRLGIDLITIRHGARRGA